MPPDGSTSTTFLRESMSLTTDQLIATRPVFLRNISSSSTRSYGFMPKSRWRVSSSYLTSDDSAVSGS